MKTKIQVQFMDKDVNVADIEKTVKEDLKSREVKINSLANLDVYYKPEDCSIYYVATTKDNKVYDVDDQPLHI